MNRHHRPGRRGLSAGLLTAAVFGAVSLFAAGRHASSARPKTGDFTPITVSPVSAKDVQAPDLREKPAVHPVRIDVDATRSGAANPVPLSAFCAVIEPPGVGPGAGSANPAVRGEVFKWGRLDSEPALVVPTSAAMPEKLVAYAARSAHGASVCIANGSEQDAPVQLYVRLAKAPYKIECLSLVLSPGTTAAPATDGQAASPTAPGAPSGWRLERLKGRDVTSTGAVAVPIMLRAGEAALVRFTDTAYASRCALNEVRDQMKRIHRASGELSRRLQVILSGCSCEKAIAANCSLNADRRRSDIHRYLLVMGQVYSLHRNFQINNEVQEGPGVEFRAALDRLNDALADTSATLMGLVPGITLTGAPPAGTVTTAVRQEGGAKPEGEADHTAYAIVTLSNEGSRPADHVKIGLDLSSLPAGALCEPAEPALFGTLAPNQSVRATYLVRWRGAANLPANRFAGDVSYFSAGAPAHLRPHTW